MKQDKYNPQTPLLEDEKGKQPEHDLGKNFGENAKPYGEDYGEDTGSEPKREEATEPEKKSDGEGRSA